MCEILIRVVDQIATDAASRASALVRGCVVDVFINGHDFGQMELTHPDWRIVKLPDVERAWGDGFMGPALSDAPSAAMTMPLLTRAFRLDIDAPSIPPDLAAYFADTTRASPSYTVNATTLPLSTLTALKVQRPLPADNVIGQPSSVIG